MCFGSSNHHFNKYKHYAKRITAIDSSKKNVYAFKGEFLSVNKKNLMPEGSFVIEVCSNYSNNLRIYRVSEDEDELLLTGNDREYVTFIKKAKEVTGL